MKEVKLIFAHDTERALIAATALINTAHDQELFDVRSLEVFAERWQWSGARAGSAAELAEVQSLRPRLERLWFVDEDEAVDIVNTLLSQARALPQLTKHDEWDYHLHATGASAPLADRMAVEAAMAMTDVIRMKEMSRLRVCAAEDCDHVLVDLSKNRSRRFCEAGCGNRANVAAYRARQGR